MNQLKKSKEKEDAEADAQKKMEYILEEDNCDIVLNVNEDEQDYDHGSSRKKKSSRNTTDISCFISEVIRYSISDRAAAALFNGALKSVNLIDEGDTDIVVDKSEIRRARNIYAAQEKTRRKNN